jgi:hypothetical protein
MPRRTKRQRDAIKLLLESGLSPVAVYNDMLKGVKELGPKLRRRAGRFKSAERSLDLWCEVELALRLLRSNNVTSASRVVFKTMGGEVSVKSLRDNYRLVMKMCLKNPRLDAYVWARLARYDELKAARTEPRGANPLH